MKRANETSYFSYVDYLQTATTNSWVLLEKEFTVPKDVVEIGIRVDNNGGGTVWFDDIRIHPAAAQMTSYTYDPLVGVTSQADASNHYTFYQYDAFKRLHIIRDQNKKIIKKFCYNY